MISKLAIHSILKSKLEQDLQTALEVEKTLESFKTQDDMKAESKYDTRSTEAGYLSTAHQKRLAEIRRDLLLCENFSQRSFGKSDDIAVGALVLLQAGELKRTIFLSLFLGGFEFEIENTLIQVVTVHSPLGKELVGLKCFDEFEFLVKGKLQTNTILSVE